MEYSTIFLAVVGCFILTFAEISSSTDPIADEKLVKCLGLAKTSTESKINSDETDGKLKLSASQKNPKVQDSQLKLKSDCITASKLLDKMTTEETNKNIGNPKMSLSESAVNKLLPKTEDVDYYSPKGPEEANKKFDNPKLLKLESEVNKQFPKSENVDYDSFEDVVPQFLIPDNETTHTESETEVSFKQMHERAQFMRIAEIKDAILSKLRLMAPPNVESLQLKEKLSQFPKHILNMKPNDELEMQSDDIPESSNDEFHAKISNILLFTTQFPEEKKPTEFAVETIAYFKIPLSISRKNLQKAVLLVYVGTPSGREGTLVQLIISSSLRKEKPFATRTVMLSKRGHWEHIDVSEQVKEWASDDLSNFGLILSAELNGINLVHLRKPDNSTSTSKHIKAPLIKVTLNDEEGRFKRSFDDVPLSCDVGDREKRCCRYKFVIDFEQLGSEFDFIIQPKRYLANYCTGSCPSYYLPSSATSQLLFGLSRQKLQRCCTPTKMKSLEIIYVDDNGNVVTGVLPNMTIEKCDCA